METNERNIIIFVFVVIAAVLFLMEMQILANQDAQLWFNDGVIKRLREIGAIQ